jgi:hypothetical protein
MVAIAEAPMGGLSAETNYERWCRLPTAQFMRWNKRGEFPRRFALSPRAVRSDRCLTAVDRHAGHRIPLHPP